MLSQVAAIYRLTEKALTALWPNKRRYILTFSVNFFISISYASSSPSSTSNSVLTPQDKAYINLLSGTMSAVPAWAIAQLLDLSDRVCQAASSQPVPKAVYLNELLAAPGQYKLRMVCIKATFVESSEVTRELQLLPPDRCWSVILLDTKYHQPIQVFTTKSPSRFQEGSGIDVVGYYLADRVDRPRRGLSSQVVVIPMFIGSLLPSEGEKPSPNTPLIQFISLKSFLALFTVLVFMIVIYFAIKIYVSQVVLRREFSPLRHGRQCDEDG